MLAVFDLSAVNNILKKSQQTYNGGVAIKISGMTKPVLQVGNGLSEHGIELATSAPNWSISFYPDESVFQAGDRTILWLVLLGVLIVFILVFMVIFRINVNLIKRDLQRVTQVVPKSIESESQFLNSFNFGEVFSMANAIVAHAREVITKYKKQDSVVDSEKPEPTKSLEDEPLIEAEMVDLEAIEPQDAGREASSERDTSFSEQRAIVEEKEVSNDDVEEGIFRYSGSSRGCKPIPVLEMPRAMDPHRCLCPVITGIIPCKLILPSISEHFG